MVFNKMLYKCNKKNLESFGPQISILDKKRLLVFDNLFGKFLIICCYVNNVSSRWKS